MTTKHVIIGTGVAGISAAQTIRRQDTSAKISIVGNDANVYYSRPGLAYYLTRELPERSLYPISSGELARQGISILKDTVTRIDANEQQISLSRGDTLAYDRLLLATGASAIKLSLPGSTLKGVLKLDHLNDAKNIIRMARTARSAVVIGGGITALEIAEGLAARGVKVHYFLRSARYWSSVLDEAESEIVIERLQDEGVNIHFHTSAAEILGKRGRVVGVKTNKGIVLRCKIVASAIGIRPRIELAKALGLRTERGILVDPYMETNLPGIYAAGDVAQVYEPLTDQYNIDSLWGPARKQGETAGLNMAGIKTAYHKNAPFNVTRLAGITTTIIGAVGNGSDPDLAAIARGDSETWRQLPHSIGVQSGFDVNRVRLMISENKIIGALVLGDQSLSQPIKTLVTQKVNITSIREQLLKPNSNITDIIIEFWTTWRKNNAAQ
ncbi:MAG: NAD(P)/FAD-dependent oxidoreductase [Anaerolineae bacterium]|nr:NAD(P)/FAD-dependent oxidoreductase [Anaerolineae bacterium]